MLYQPRMTPSITPESVTMRSIFSRIHFLVSAVTLRGPCEAETSCPPILAKRYSEKRADDFSSISLARSDDKDNDPDISRDLSRLTAEPQQHHDDDGLPFWGCCEKFVRTDLSLPSIHLRSSLTAWQEPIDSIVVVDVCLQTEMSASFIRTVTSTKNNYKRTYLFIG